MRQWYSKSTSGFYGISRQAFIATPPACVEITPYSKVQEQDNPFLSGQCTLEGRVQRPINPQFSQTNGSASDVGRLLDSVEAPFPFLSSILVLAISQSGK